MSAVTVDRPPESPQDDERTMTILEHLQELRNRLMICGIALGISMGASMFFLANPVIRWLKQPAEAKVPNFELIYTQPLEYWTVYFQVALYAGLVFAMPVLVWQLLAFVGPGLTRNEKRWAYPIVLGASGMFVLGCAFAYYVEMPPALNFLLKSNDIAQPFITVRSYVSFATKMLIVNGLVFETPLIVMGLAKVGVLTSRRIFGWWRYIILGAFVISAVITPSIDPITQTLVAVPMVVLFMFGGVLAKLVEKNPIIPRM
ncbi:MAG TPA: twin-arginine translocase subunit TatC [Dehalococcoidia bacterium]|jgi:sec-independent protein translocase protein TatC